ncbi:hypothetical protein [Micromonospora sp. LOL_023]|uniref:hypothetical protein n=1 Tax=Micromonospora sp. LOL_023 TaxID=3345418 RepID=UPI003A864A55
MYQVVDALLIRASTQPTTVDLPAWPDLTGGPDADDVRDWLTAVWSRRQLDRAITVASPELAEQVERVCAGRAARDPGRSAVAAHAGTRSVRDRIPVNTSLADRHPDAAPRRHTSVTPSKTIDLGGDAPTDEPSGRRSGR